MRARPRATALAGVLLLAAASAMVEGAGSGLPAPVPAITGEVVPAALAAPPTTAQCVQLLHISCYQPSQLRRAYDLDPLLKDGKDGHGRTIAIVDSLGAPNIAADLHGFDAALGIPDPPSLRIITPAGAPPPFDLHSAAAGVWALETTLDVEWAHAMAPGARILLVVTPIPETEGLTGFPQIVSAERYVVDHGLADVISQSFGSAEATFASPAVIAGLRSAFVAAERHDVTVLAATGDTGSTLHLPNAACCYPVPVVSWPASDPLVTAVGGTRLQLDATGHRTAKDTVWNDGAGGAAGGGLSSVFARPDYQDPVRDVVGGRRGIPDVSLTAALSGAAVFLFTLPTPGGPAGGWSIAGGTSLATPILAGIVAIADQVAGHRLGLLNDHLYRIAGHDSSGLVDVTSGTNAVTICVKGCLTPTPVLVPIPGYAAARGYDLASGLGTVRAADLADSLDHAGG
ncbi:MAG TPA: S53 family peptidase [Candidatus Dormibacteraeota bacterium]|nr:S53 family peptidase [Candidatus Dormibacteraeota bacterium]